MVLLTQSTSSRQPRGDGHHVPWKMSHAASLKPDVTGPSLLQSLSFFWTTYSLPLDHRPYFWQENFQDKIQVVSFAGTSQYQSSFFILASHKLTFSPHSSILDWYGASRQQNPGMAVTVFDASPLAKEHTCPMVVFSPNTRAIALSKRSLVMLNCVLSCVLQSSDSKGSPVGDGDFHASTPAAVSVNPN